MVIAESCVRADRLKGGFRNLIRVSCLGNPWRFRMQLIYILMLCTICLVPDAEKGRKQAFMDHACKSVHRACMSHYCVRQSSSPVSP